MPIHDLGYRTWQGRLTSARSRWAVIAETGARRAWQSTWVRRILFFAWLPLLLFGTIFVLYERAAHGDQLFQSMIFGLAQAFPEISDQMRPGDGASPTEVLNSNRHAIWLYTLQVYFRYPQGVAMVLLIGLIAPRLISEDVETRAFLFYFSRPLGRLEYLLGKSATVWFFIAGITTLPALCMYFLGIVLSPEATVVFDTWDIPLRILLASVTVIVPAAALALCFSSLTKESRYAGFGWFAIWILGMVAFLFLGAWRTGGAPPIAERRAIVVQIADQRGDRDGLASREELEAATAPDGGGIFNLLSTGRDTPDTVETLMDLDVNGDGRLSRIEVNPPVHNFEEYFSLHHTFGAVQRWVFGLESFNSVKYFVLTLSTLTTVCLLLLFRRVSAPMRA